MIKFPLEAYVLHTELTVLHSLSTVLPSAYQSSTLHRAKE